MARFSRFLFVLLIAFAGIMKGQDFGSVSGSVLDKETGDPVPSANVILKGTSIGAASGLDGSFGIDKVPVGSYTVVISSVGYETEEINGIVVAASADVRVNAVLSETSVQLADVTVLGASMRSEKITDAPAAVSIVDSREIRLNAVSGQVPKLLETQPGVDIVQSGTYDYNVNTRGFNSSLNRRLLVLLDGRDMAVAFLGSQEWSGFSVPVEDLGKMELIRGPGSALYGANAFNGVINILTPSPRSIPGGKVTIAGGELNTFRTDVRYAGFSNAWSYKVNAGRSQAGTWSVSRPPFEYDGFSSRLNSEIIPVDKSNVVTMYGSARVDYQFDDDGTATVEGGATNVENPILVTGIGRIQVPKAIKPWIRLNYSTQSWFVQGWGAWRNSIEPQISLSTGLPLKEKSLIGQLDVQYRFSALGDRLFAILGGAHRYQSVDTDGTLTLAPHYDNSSSLYAQLEYRFLDGLKAVGAARWDRSTLHEDQLSPKLAMVYSPIGGQTFRATYNQAFQAPNYSELFLYVKHPTSQLAYLGNEDLVVEKITGYEIGYSGVFGNMLFATVDAYYNQLEDFITDLAPAVNPNYPGQVMLPGENFLRTIWSYGNAGKADEMGFEVGITYYLTRHIPVTANYAYFAFDVKEQGANDVLLPNAPSDKINVGVAYQSGPLDASVSVKYVPSYDWAAGIYKGRILAYAIVNLSASFDLTHYLQIGANITNLLDRTHYQIFGGSLIHRRAVMSLTARF